MADVTLSSIKRVPRRATYVLTASNASFPIPSWAQGGKGIVYVTGCGGGGSGQVHATQNGIGGGAAGFAVRHPIHIASGVTTCAAVIGAGAAGVSAAATAQGGQGGETTLTVGALVLRLEGGSGPGGTIPAGSRRLAYMGPQYPSTFTPGSDTSTPLGNMTTSAAQVQGGLASAPTTLGSGAQGGSGTTASGAFGGGGTSLFGGGGAGFAAANSANTNGNNATGYGAGGSGARWLSGGAVTSGAGSPGLLILEFVEAF